MFLFDQNLHKVHLVAKYEQWKITMHMNIHSLIMVLYIENVFGFDTFWSFILTLYQYTFYRCGESDFGTQ